MKKLITLCMIIIAMQLNSQMIKTNQGSDEVVLSKWVQRIFLLKIKYSQVAELVDASTKINSKDNIE
jgi:hypothetical protein